MIVLLAAVALGQFTAAARGQTALDNYVAAPDAYSTVGLGTTYSLANTVLGSGYTGYVLDMTSQVWRTTAEVDRTDWQHWLTVITPDVVTSDRALLFITGGNNGGGAPNWVDSTLAQYATATGSVVAELRAVPNQPLFFTDEVPPNGRVEDEIIAYTFDKYLDDPADDSWPLLEPMVKSAVRAMDTVQDYVPQVAAGADVAKFVVSGVSKRGWTTWLTAASDAAAAPQDRRVEAIMPVVIDVLTGLRQRRRVPVQVHYRSQRVVGRTALDRRGWRGDERRRQLGQTPAVVPARHGRLRSGGKLSGDAARGRNHAAAGRRQ